MAKMIGSTRLKKIVVCRLPDFLPFPKNLLFPLVKGKEIAAVPKDEHHIRFSDLIANDGRYTPHPVKDPAEEVAILQYTGGTTGRSEEHTSELQSLMRISYAVFCLKNKIKYNKLKQTERRLYT